MTEDKSDNLNIETNEIKAAKVEKKPVGRPRRQEPLTDIERKNYMHNYYKEHYIPKPKINKLGRPIKPEHEKLTADMTAYQREYRRKKRLNSTLNSMD